MVHGCYMVTTKRWAYSTYHIMTSHKLVHKWAFIITLVRNPKSYTVFIINELDNTRRKNEQV